MAIVRVAVIVAIAACALAAAGHAAMYKWVDEQGVTHYGEKPPPGRKAQPVQIRKAPAGDPSKEKDSPSRLQEQEREFQQRRVDRLEKERQEEKERARVRAEAQQMKKACIAARNNLEALNKDLPVYRLDEKGERRFVDDKNRAGEIAQAKKEIATYCKS